VRNSRKVWLEIPSSSGGNETFLAKIRIRIRSGNRSSFLLNWWEFQA